MSERVNVIRDGRASFREEKLAKDLSWRAGELETLLSAVLYFFAKDGGTLVVPQRVDQPSWRFFI